jgi:hypothetical protein
MKANMPNKIFTCGNLNVFNSWIFSRDNTGLCRAWKSFTKVLIERATLKIFLVIKDPGIHISNTAKSYAAKKRMNQKMASIEDFLISGASAGSLSEV